MSAVERNVVVSTDSSGALGTPRVWKDVWGFMDKYPGFQGFEMIGWGGGVLRFWTDYLLVQAKKESCKVMGIHGRTGPLYGNTNLAQGLLVRSLSAFMIPTPKLLDCYGPRVKYVLVHSGELGSPSRQASLFKPEGNHFNRLFIENDTTVGGVNYAATLVKQIYRGYRVKAGVMFDLWHHIASLGGGYKIAESWKMAMGKLRWVFEQKYEDGTPLVAGIHLPVGTIKWDSLPLADITCGMWQTLREVLDSRPDALVVIENQQSNPRDWILPSRSRRAQQRDRNVAVMGVLHRCGII